MTKCRELVVSTEICLCDSQKILKHAPVYTHIFKGFITVHTFDILTFATASGLF